MSTYVRLFLQNKYIIDCPSDTLIQNERGEFLLPTVVTVVTLLVLRETSTGLVSEFQYLPVSFTQTFTGTPFMPEPEMVTANDPTNGAGVFGLTYTGTNLSYVRVTSPTMEYPQ